MSFLYSRLSKLTKMMQNHNSSPTSHSSKGKDSPSSSNSIGIKEDGKTCSLEILSYPDDNEAEKTNRSSESNNHPGFSQKLTYTLGSPSSSVSSPSLTKISTTEVPKDIVIPNNVDNHNKTQAQESSQVIHVNRPSLKEVLANTKAKMDHLSRYTPEGAPEEPLILPYPNIK